MHHLPGGLPLPCAAGCVLCFYRAIAQLFPALCHLRQCQLSLCAALDDIALTHLVAGASLTTLDLRGCWKITDAGAMQEMQQVVCRTGGHAAAGLQDCNQQCLKSGSTALTLVMSCCPACFDY